MSESLSSGDFSPPTVYPHLAPPRDPGYTCEAPKRRRAGPWGWLLFGVALGIVVIGGAFLATNLYFDSAASGYALTYSSASDAASQTRMAIEDASDASAGASAVLDVDTSLVLDSTHRDALALARERVVTSAEGAAVLVDREISSVPNKPVLPWELLLDAQDLLEETDELSTWQDELQRSVAALSDDTAAVNEAGVAALESASAAAVSLEESYRSASNETILSLRRSASAAAQAASSEDFGAEAGFVLASVATDASAVTESAARQWEERAGPLQNSYLEAESFARSLAPGLLLEFTWSPLVNGLGFDGWMSGQASWWHDQGGYAFIELSDSIARAWPSDRSRAIIAHEVGHAITVRCPDLYDSSDPVAVEHWATAWAIGMGFTHEANGTSAYGAPPDSMVDTSRECR